MYSIKVFKTFQFHFDQFGKLNLSTHIFLLMSELQMDKL